MAALIFALSLSSDVQAAWTPYVTVKGSFGTALNTNDFAVSPVDGSIYVSWFGGDTTGNTFLWAQCNPTNPPTCPAGGTVTAPIPGNIDPETATAELNRPSVVINSVGDVYIGYFDSGYGQSAVAHIKRKLHNQSTWSTFKDLGQGWQVRLALDKNGNIYAVWGVSGVLNFVKLDPNGNQLGTVSNFTDNQGIGSTIAVDSLGRGHIVYEDPNHNEAYYVQIAANGNSATNPIDISNTDAQSANANIVVGPKDKLYIAWQEATSGHMIFYEVCDPGVVNCSAMRQIGQPGNDALDPIITLVGNVPFITYMNKILNPDGTRSFLTMVWNGYTKQLSQVDNAPNEWFPVIRASSTGELNLVYREVQNGALSLRYRHMPANVATPTATSTTTNTPTITNTPTETLTPTITDTPTDTATPTDTPTPCSACTDTPTPTSTSTQTSTPTSTPTVRGTPINLTKDTNSKDWIASLAMGPDGKLVVAYERDDKTTGAKQIFARTSADGINFVKANVSGTSTRALEPSVFADNTSVNVLYQIIPSGDNQFDIFDRRYSSGTWKAPADQTNTDGYNSATGVGVQDSNGNIWVAWRESTSTLSNDIYAKKNGGAAMQVSSSGSASYHPAIAADTNGNVFVAWLDKGIDNTDYNLMIEEWNGTQWTPLPNISSSQTAVNPSLAYGNGKLYAVWQDNGNIYQRTWNGSWSTPTKVNSAGIAAAFPRVAVSSTGDAYVTWSDSGVIYLSKNGAARRKISGAVTGSNSPGIYISPTGIPYVTWTNGDVWFVKNP